jgi:hypothetical protein
MKLLSFRTWPWYAPALGAYPPVFIAASNPGQVEMSTIVLIAAISATATVAVMAMLRPLLGSRDLIGIGAIWIVLLFYAYGPANEWWLDFVQGGLEQRSAGDTWFSRYPQIIHSLVWALLALSGLDQMRRRRCFAAPRLNSGLNFAAAVLAGFVVVQSLLNLMATDEDKSTTSLAAATATGTRSGVADPDIYFIVLDGYARADILREYYGFDNTPFLNELRELGFQVSDASRANFAWTFLSLGSALNLDYVQPLLGERLDRESRDRKEIYRLLRDNRASHFLKQRGYRTVHLQSTWGGTGTNAFADEFIPCQTGMFGTEYLRAVADASWLRAFSSKLSLDVANCHLKNFETLADQAKSASPKFVFAHFLPPHHPYLFDREGHILRRATVSDQFEFQKRLWEDRDSYVDQLIFVNRRIAEVVGRILKDSSHPPVIMLLSDHGPNLKDGIMVPEERRIRFANLTAMFLPSAPSDFLPSDATPVNHLRRVFNLYFGARLAILPDRFFASSYQRPFDLQEVGDNYEPLP